ncbi:MAG: uroporphyrinogen-III synthase [Bacteroidetes bacterium]|nr:uroporphyrinogen-III synthase [Bacteroidota bacterium]
MKSVFISRKLSANSPIYILSTELNFNLFDLPLIDTVKIPFSYTPQTNWIFFSSKNAINYFFEQNPNIPYKVKYGVVGQSSANELLNYSTTVDFIGRGNDIVKIAKDFREILGNESVLFPQAMDSLQSIQKQIAFTNTTHNLYTYKTIIKSNFEVPYTDILIFTSPSNAKTYFTKYKIDDRQTIIAMGASTKYALSEYGVRNVLVPDEFTEESISSLIKELI